MKMAMRMTRTIAMFGCFGLISEKNMTSLYSPQFRTVRFGLHGFYELHMNLHAYLCILTLILLFSISITYTCHLLWSFSSHCIIVIAMNHSVHTNSKNDFDNCTRLQIIFHNCYSTITNALKCNHFYKT